MHYLLYLEKVIILLYTFECLFEFVNSFEFILVKNLSRINDTLTKVIIIFTLIQR